MMKSLLVVVLASLSLLCLDSQAAADDDDGAATCSESKYGLGRHTASGCIELEIETISNCTKPINIYADYAWEGKDAYGNRCMGSKEKEHVMFIGTKKSRTWHVSACRCNKMERAWITKVTAKYAK